MSLQSLQSRPWPARQLRQLPRVNHHQHPIWSPRRPGLEDSNSNFAKAIKSQRAPPWPCLPTADLPPKDVADELVDCYLRTSETIYRILHVPTFHEDYKNLWDTCKEVDRAFLVQVKLVFAVGAIVFDEHFSLRTSAIRWVYEAQTWLSGPKFKSRLDFQTLQTEILLLLARELVSSGGEPIWISAGALVRKAIYMGLHRDPSNLPSKPNFDAEMHRRLWNTILEICLQSSLTSGGPPNISPHDFETKPPGNFDDEQMTAEAPMPNEEDTFTQSSIAIALRKTFSIRLAVTKHLNDLKSHGTYEETLRLDAELRASYKSLSRSLQGCSSKIDSFPSRFEIRFVDFIMHRYISALHIPFFGPTLQETRFAYSRKVVIETAFKTWYAANPTLALVAAQSYGNSTSSDVDDFVRLAAYGSGFSRTIVTQSVIIIAVELRAQLKEDESLGPVFLRPDFPSVLDDAKTWCLQCIKAGEINIKGYLLISALTAHVHGLMQGVGKDEIPGLVMKAVQDAETICLPILEEMVAEESGNGLQETTANTPIEIMEDWDFMIEDPMTWVFGNGNAHEPPQW